MGETVEFSGTCSLILGKAMQGGLGVRVDFSYVRHDRGSWNVLVQMEWCALHEVRNRMSLPAVWRNPCAFFRRGQLSVMNAGTCTYRWKV